MPIETLHLAMLSTSDHTTRGIVTNDHDDSQGRCTQMLKHVKRPSLYQLPFLRYPEDYETEMVPCGSTIIETTVIGKVWSEPDGTLKSVTSTYTWDEKSS